jgi:hypothetical protein
MPRRRAASLLFPPQRPSMSRTARRMMVFSVSSFTLIKLANGSRSSRDRKRARLKKFSRSAANRNDEVTHRTGLRRACCNTVGRRINK